VDRRKYDLDKAMAFVEGALDIAPVFYISGNHEAWSGKYSTIKKELEDAGVHVLDNDVIRLSIGGSSIHMFGVRDPDFHTSNYLEGTDITEMTDQFKKWSSYKSFKILLSHRPELFDLYCENKMDLIFTGHAHGGQVRIPFIGGLVAPDQGLFPKYTSGYYTKDESTMFVSRGLGNSIIPIRIFNRPEIVVVTLKTKE
jgi:predicted MPP superfamily phosphohydrolase